MTSMNIWLIQIGEPLPLNKGVRKMRVAILADHLLARGHSVVWWGSAFDHLSKKWLFNRDTQFKTSSGLQIIALRGIAYKKNISVSRFIALRLITRKFRKMAPTIQRPDIIITSTPSYDLAYEAVSFAKKYNIPVIVDIRDEWPDSFIKYTFINRLPFSIQKVVRMLLYKDFSIIKSTMQRADGLTSIMSSLLDWGLAYANRPKSWKDRVFHLGYLRDVIPIDHKNKITNLLVGIKDKFVITFIGTFGVCNNPMMILDCAKSFDAESISFVLAGDGDLMHAMIKRASELNLKNVLFPGWLNKAEIALLLKYTHVGLAPTSQLRDAFPNKIFAYLSEGIPIISAWQGELKEIIEKHQIGFNCLPNDAEAMANSINALYKDRELYRTMSKNALDIFYKKFDAGKIYNEYVIHIEKVAQQVNYSV